MWCVGEHSREISKRCDRRMKVKNVWSFNKFLLSQVVSKLAYFSRVFQMPDRFRDAELADLETVVALDSDDEFLERRCVI